MEHSDQNAHSVHFPGMDVVVSLLVLTVVVTVVDVVVGVVVINVVVLVIGIDVLLMGDDVVVAIELVAKVNFSFGFGVVKTIFGRGILKNI